jgi:DNA polymerase
VERSFTTAAPLIPRKRSLAALERAAAACRACDLWKRATQTVFGEGRARAAVLLVGEQPGSDEDLSGRPFVGPAGRLLDSALAEAGIARESIYVTNAVKHFNWEARGKRRIHKKPTARHVAACRPWLLAEIAAVRPKIIVCLGATAAGSLLGSDFRVTKQRGKVIERDGIGRVLATVHPSSILRAPDPVSRRREMRRFVADLKKVSLNGT